MKKLLLSLTMSVLTIIPGVTAVSCSTINNTITMNFASDVKVKKMTWDKKEGKYKEDTKSASTKQTDIINSLNGIVGTPFQNLISNVLNILNYNVITRSDKTQEYTLFRGKGNNTSIIGQYTDKNTEKAKDEFYNNLAKSGTSIASIKGLLELRDYIKKDKKDSIPNTWKDKPLYKQAEMVKSWDDNLVKNLNKIVNSSDDGNFKSVMLASKISSTNSSFTTFEINSKDKPNKEGKNVEQKEVKDKVLGDIIKNDSHKDYIFGTDSSNDPYGMNVVNDGNIPNVDTVKPTLKYSSETLKNDGKFINIADDNNQKNFAYNFDQNFNASSKTSFYYINEKNTNGKSESEDLKLDLVYRFQNNNEFNFEVTFSGMRKVFIPILESYTPNLNVSKDDKKDIKYGNFGWKFIDYLFSTDYSKGANSLAKFQDISVSNITIKNNK